MRSRVPSADVESNLTTWKLELFDFIDNEQYSNLDSFLVQIGTCDLFLSEDLEDGGVESRKVRRVLDGRAALLQMEFVKKSNFKRPDISDLVRKLVSRESHESTVAEVIFIYL